MYVMVSIVKLHYDKTSADGWLGRRRPTMVKTRLGLAMFFSRVTKTESV
jgi:hypothetical protein